MQDEEAIVTRDRMSSNGRTERSSIGRERQRGQVMPVALVLLMLASAVLVMMYRTGQGVTEKSQLANAADAAAYSGAVWTARHLNFMAYTNRAMIANHVTVGHFVSYMSWFRYLAGTVKEFKRFAQFVPYVGSVVTAINQVLQTVKTATEAAAKITVPLIDGANALYRTAQLDARGTLAFGGLNSLMKSTARSYDNTVEVNDLNLLQEMPIEIAAPLGGQLLVQQTQLLGFVKTFTASNDGGRLNDVIGKTLQADDDLRHWVSGARGWDVSIACVKFIKQGSTSHSQTATAADWRATDRLRSDPCNPFANTKTIGRAGSASAREFARTYRGVASYQDLDSNRPKGQPTDVGLMLIAVVMKRQSDTGMKSPNGYANIPLMGMESSKQPTSSMAAAMAEFHRPRGVGFTELTGKTVEYGNLFNPFWEAHLTRFDPLAKLLGGGP
jgi:hypothetical protein